MLGFILLTSLAILGTLFSYGYSSLSHIRSNWVEYRCHPAYIPFANMVKPDVSTSENFLYCTGIWGNELIKPSIDILNSMFGTLGASMSEITGGLGIFRNMFSRIRGFMLSFAIATFGKIANSSSIFIHVLIKIQDVLRRITGEGYLASILGYIGISFIESLVSLCISIIKTFIYIMLAMSFILAMFQPEILAIVLVLASMMAAAGA